MLAIEHDKIKTLIAAVYYRYSQGVPRVNINTLQPIGELEGLPVYSLGSQFWVLQPRTAFDIIQRLRSSGRCLKEPLNVPVRPDRDGFVDEILEYQGDYSSRSLTYSEPDDDYLRGVSLL